MKSTVFFLVLALWGTLPAIDSKVRGSDGAIEVDVGRDGVSELTLDGTGVGIGATPSENLELLGNAVISGTNVGIGTPAPLHGFHNTGTWSLGPAQVVSSNATLSANSLILVDTASSNVDLTLPNAATVIGLSYFVKMTNATNEVNLLTYSNQKIDRYTKITLTTGQTELPFIKVVSSGSQWFVTSRNYEIPVPTGIALVDGLFESYFEGTFNDTQLDDIDSGTGFLVMTPDATNVLDTDLDFNGTNMDTRSGGVVGTDTIGAVWYGKMVIGEAASGAPLEAGDISLGTASDDGSVFWVDSDQDGDFEAGELVVDNKGSHGVVQRTGTINLAAGTYDIAIGFYEGGGGEAMEARYAQGNGVAYTSQTIIDPSDAAQSGLWMKEP